MVKDKENTKRQSTELVANCDLILELLSRTWGKKWFGFTLMRDITATELIKKIKE